MTRREVKTFLQSGINALNAGISYGGGRLSEFDSERMQSYPKIWLEPLKTKTDIKGSGLPYDGWQVVLNIGKLDKLDSSADQYESLVDDCDLIAQELIFKLDQQVTDSDKVIISGNFREPFIKKYADLLTGIKLSFTLSSPDTTNWC